MYKVISSFRGRVLCVCDKSILLATHPSHFLMLPGRRSLLAYARRPTVVQPRPHIVPAPVERKCRASRGTFSCSQPLAVASQVSRASILSSHVAWHRRVRVCMSCFDVWRLYQQVPMSCVDVACTRITHVRSTHFTSIYIHTPTCTCTHRRHACSSPRGRPCATSPHRHAGVAGKRSQRRQRCTYFVASVASFRFECVCV